MNIELTKIWSCKLNRPETLKSHRSLESASKQVGDYGVVYDPTTDAVYQVFEMANGTFGRFNTVTQSHRCNVGGFDLRQVLEDNHIRNQQDEN